MFRELHCMELWLANWKGTNLNLQRVVGKWQNWQWIFPQSVTWIFVCNCRGQSEFLKRGIGGKIYLCWRYCLPTQWLKLKTKWIYKGKYASFHMERKRPNRSSIKQSIFPISVFRVELPAGKKMLSAPRAVKHGSCLHHSPCFQRVTLNNYMCKSSFIQCQTSQVDESSIRTYSCYAKIFDPILN